ncbi:DUF3307 domain-containing protein (plasmid) [Actinomadura graeca]|uniref:DUF3307 domain-containing protein n=1 Tax=Actinomadura graeca TaxID=2750812 RepID=A0ABX8R9D4_9ACTN|nr:DUF3307 domain-containing protein [Actinomadura graeca]QXJ27079.1 DUF3307 domain-containing protein [Actinomadura graeca]
MSAGAAVFAAVFAALYAAHELGDHWIQTSAQACGKGAAGWRGRVLCARHVASLTAVKVLAVAVMAAVTGLELSPQAAVAGLAVDAVSHYWADRRSTLLALARRVGKGEFAALGDGAAAPTGTGAYALDQSWHVMWLFVAALMISAGAS